MYNQPEKLIIYGKTKEETASFEDLYQFIKASLVALQPTDGFGEADFECPVCKQKAHIKRERKNLYSKTDIDCLCGYSFHC